MLTLKPAGLAAGRARDEAPDAGQHRIEPASGTLVRGGDDRIITAGDRRGTPARVLVAVLIGMGVAPVFASGPALRWTETLPDSRLTTALHDAAARWNGMLAASGAFQLHDWLHARTRSFEAMRF